MIHPIILSSTGNNWLPFLGQWAGLLLSVLSATWLVIKTGLKTAIKSALQETIDEVHRASEKQWREIARLGESNTWLKSALAQQTSLIQEISDRLSRMEGSQSRIEESQHESRNEK